MQSPSADWGKIFCLLPSYRIRDIDLVESRYYMRLQLLDKPGALGKITNVFGLHGISLASVVQKEELESDYAPVVMLTHEASDHNISQALEEIGKMDILTGNTVRIRIEDF